MMIKLILVESSLSTLSSDIIFVAGSKVMVLRLHLPHAPGSHGANISYFGPVFSMSSPSLISPTIFVSIEEGVVHRNLVATDGLYKNSWFNIN